MAYDVNSMSPRTGRILKEDGTFINEADLALGRYTPTRVKLTETPVSIPAGQHKILPAFSTHAYRYFALYGRAEQNDRFMLQLRFLDPDDCTFAGRAARYKGYEGLYKATLMQVEPVFAPEDQQVWVVNTGATDNVFEVWVYLWR